MQADRGVSRAGAAGDEADADASRHISIGRRHETGAALMAASDEARRIAGVAKRIECREIALAGDAENDIAAIRPQGVDQYLTTCSTHSNSLALACRRRRCAGLSRAYN